MENKYTTTTTTDKSLDMVSLFDYLHHPAGSRLGKEVAAAASRQNIRTEIRQVSNKKYSGPILLYPKYFLDGYFNKTLLQ
jgi:hypothetical protein